MTLGTESPVEKQKILVVDDDDQTRRLFRMVLEKAGYEVSEAANGRYALNHLDSEMVDLIVADIIMPDMEGLETIQHITKRFPTIKIIAISGGGKIGPDDYLKMARALGAHRALQKPIDPDDLQEAVRELLTPHPSEPE